MSVNKEIEGNPKVFDIADMHLKCHSCGEDVTVFENVKGGLRMDLYTTDQHKLTLKCDKCGATLELYYTEAANPPKEKEDEKENEKVQVETTEVNEPQTEEVEELIEELREELDSIDEKLEKEETEDEQIPEESKTEE